jgi:MerR family transcriptional regulator, light-induced transcriptional regulator
VHARTTSHPIDFHGVAPEAVIFLVEDLTEQAVAWTSDAIYDRYRDLLTPFGGKGRHHTRQDLRYHVEFLIASLATGDAFVFGEYARWLHGVLRARQVPEATLSESLSLLNQFYEQHLLPDACSSVTDVLTEGLASANESLSPRQSPVEQPNKTVTSQQSADVETLTRCLLQGDADGARRILLRAGEQGCDYVRVATQLFQPSLKQIGLMWERNEITVAQEHLATAISQTLLTQLLASAEFADPLHRKALFACVEGNHHALGVRIVADAFELAGWSVQFLGADVPCDALLAQIAAWCPDTVGLSVAIVYQLPSLQRTVAAMRRTFGAKCPTILVGGSATMQIDDICCRFGADVWYPDASRLVAKGHS